MKYILDDIEADRFFHKHFSLLANESDMGCVLIGASAIDQQLKLLFEQILPSDTNSKIRKRIFDGRGVFGELSSKLDIAYTCRLIPIDVYESVHALRKLRNQVAHEVTTFELKNHLTEIYNIFSRINGNLLGLMMDSSQSLIYQQVMSEVLAAEDPIEPSQKLFKTHSEATDFIMDNPDVLKRMSQQRLRVAFVIGVCLVGASIVFYKNQSISKFA